jgi:hypothetical protein
VSTPTILRDPTLLQNAHDNIVFAEGADRTITQGVSQAPKTGTANSLYQKIDNQNPNTIVSETTYDANGRPAIRKDYYSGSNPHTHYDKVTGKNLTNHKHIYRYNSDGQKIGETVEPLP